MPKAMGGDKVFFRHTELALVPSQIVAKTVVGGREKLCLRGAAFREQNLEGCGR